MSTEKVCDIILIIEEFDKKMLIDMLINPPEPNYALIKAMTNYKKNFSTNS